MVVVPNQDREGQQGALGHVGGLGCTPQHLVRQEGRVQTVSLLQVS